MGLGVVAAVVSAHPVQRLAPARANVEPHHRVVREISQHAPLVPAAFGHIGGGDGDILAVLRGNHAEIRLELERLAGRCEMGLTMRWRVPNLVNHLVRSSRDLREGRDRAFRGRVPSMNEKLQVGALFEATLARERERLTAIVLGALQSVALDVFHGKCGDEKMVCRTAILVERARVDAFEAALGRAATLFDASIGFESSGPWPPYSFVRLRLHTNGAPAAA
jgi:hypothetical protein